MKLFNPHGDRFSHVMPAKDFILSNAVACAMARAFPAVIHCPHCGAMDGFLHVDGGDIEFVCRSCFGFELGNAIQEGA